MPINFIEGLGTNLPLPEIPFQSGLGIKQGESFADSLNGAAIKLGENLAQPFAGTENKPVENFVQPLSGPGFMQGESFTDSLKGFISDVNTMQFQSAELTDKMIKGEPVDIHDVMIAAEKAKTSFQLLMEMRNKFIDLYKEVMRIPL